MSRKRKTWRAKPPREERKYYSIGEVSRLFGVEEHILRYWEEVTPLKPERSPMSDARMYKKEDLELVGKIHHLVVERGLAPAVVATLLDIDDVDTHLELRNRLVEVQSRLVQMRNVVREVKNQVNE